MEKVKTIYDNLQEDIQIKIMEEYIVPQLIEDELINKFDELIDSEECKRLNWRVLTNVVSKIIENECALSKMCKKDVCRKHVFCRLCIKWKKRCIRIQRLI